MRFAAALVCVAALVAAAAVTVPLAGVRAEDGDGMVELELALGERSEAEAEAGAAPAPAQQCEKLVRWGHRYIKVLHETLRDLHHDIRVQTRSIKYAQKGADEMLNDIKVAWGRRCSVAKRKAKTWTRLRTMRKQNLRYHQKRLAMHKWAKKLQEQDKANRAMLRQYIQQFGEVEGRRRYKEEHKARLAAERAKLGRLQASGVHILYKVMKGMVTDAREQYLHAVHLRHKWNRYNRICKKLGKKEADKVRASMSRRARHGNRHIKNAKRRIKIVKKLLRKVRAVRARRESQYTTKHYLSCKLKDGRHKYRCHLSPDSRTSKCFRFFRCSNHAWQTKDKRLVAVCTV